MRPLIQGSVSHDPHEGQGRPASWDTWTPWTVSTGFRMRAMSTPSPPARIKSQPTATSGLTGQTQMTAISPSTRGKKTHMA